MKDLKYKIYKHNPFGPCIRDSRVIKPLLFDIYVQIISCAAKSNKITGNFELHRFWKIVSSICKKIS
jgi:hypothetical protein